MPQPCHHFSLSMGDLMTENRWQFMEEGPRTHYTILGTSQVPRCLGGLKPLWRMELKHPGVTSSKGPWSECPVMVMASMLALAGGLSVYQEVDNHLHQH